MALTITKENFEKEVLTAKQPVVVDFWASWCGPCKMIAPAIEELSTELSGQATVGKINIDEQPELAMKYGVMSIPTILLFKDGDVANKIVGAMGKNELKANLGL